MKQLENVPAFDQFKEDRKDTFVYGPYVIFYDNNDKNPGWCGQVCRYDNGYKKDKVVTGAKNPGYVRNILESYVAENNGKIRGLSPEEYKKQEKLTKEIKALEKEYFEFSSTNSIKNLNFEYINCPVCRSQLNKRLLHSNRCPLCHTDLRRKYVLDKIEQYRSRLDFLKKEIV